MPALAETMSQTGRAIDQASEAEQQAGLERDRLFRIRYLIANAYGVDPGDLTSPPASVKAATARSLAIAVARDILLTDLGSLARHFGCAGPAEAAEHCNLIARRCEADHRLATTRTFARASCAAVLGLDV